MALYDDEMADQAFTIFKENRKSIRLNPIIESDLYGNEEIPRQTTPNISPLSPEAIENLSTDQMRTIILVLFSISNQNTNHSHSNPNPIPSQHANPIHSQVIDADSDAATDPNIDSRNRNEPKFRLEIALGRLQNYYSKATKFGGDFEDDLEDALAEFETACKGQLAPEDAKPELLRLAINGRALTF